MREGAPRAGPRPGARGRRSWGVGAPLPRAARWLATWHVLRISKGHANVASHLARRLLSKRRAIGSDRWLATWHADC